MAKKPQLYPDMTPCKVVFYDKATPAVILFKRGSQYTVCLTAVKLIMHYTEKRLTAEIAEAKLLDTPLHQALE